VVQPALVALFSAMAHSTSSIIGLLPVFTLFPCAGSCGEPVTQTSRVPWHLGVFLPVLFNVLGVALAA
jgi:hypothetical protein